MEEVEFEEDEEQKLDRHFAEVRGHLEQQLLGFGELDLALTDLVELSLRCRECGVSAETLEALDAAMGLCSTQAETEEEENASDDGQPASPCLTCDVEIDDSDAPADVRKQKADVLACAGDYFALFRCAWMAEAQHGAAAEVDPACLAAWLGRGRALAERCSARARKVAPDAALATATLSAASHCCRLLAAEKAQWSLQHEGLDVALRERRACQCLQLLDDAVGLWEMSAGVAVASAAGDACGETATAAVGLGLERQLDLLRQAVDFLDTPAASSVESLARRWLSPAPWLPQPLEPVDAVGVPLPDYVRALLVRSQAFCHPRLERHLARWRAGLCRGLFEAASAAPGGDCGRQVLHQAADAAALACHLLFAGYCVPCTGGPAGGEEERTLERARTSLAGRPAGAGGLLMWLIVMMYESVGCGETVPGQEAAGGAAGLLALDEVATLINRCVRHPQEEAALVQELPTLSESGALPETPCRAFYDDTVYPPWHDSVESSGVLPLSIAERLRQYFPWWEATGHVAGIPGSAASTSCSVASTSRSIASTSRSRPCVLVAGCGSGHQVAVEVRTYADCDFVALDCSPRAVARARRTLRAVLGTGDFARLRFVVGDILELDAAAARRLAGGGRSGFDLVVCCGVLHHLQRPEEGLARLAAALAPGGVLQLATYSRLSVETWQPLALEYLRSAPASRHLYGTAGALLRAPTREEVRAIRAGVLALPAGDDVRDLLVHFREFFTYAGILDLLFHPLERLYTLSDIAKSLLPAARLRVIGVFFPDVNADLSARNRFRKAGGVESDPHMVDLERWHALEVVDPDMFGRMHTMFLERDVPEDDPPGHPSKRTSEDASVGSAAAQAGAAAVAAPASSLDAGPSGEPLGKRLRGAGEES